MEMIVALIALLLLLLSAATYILRQVRHHKNLSIDTSCFFCNKRTIVVRPGVDEEEESTKIANNNVNVDTHKDQLQLRPVGSRIECFGKLKTGSSSNCSSNSSEGGNRVSSSSNSNFRDQPFASHFDSLGRLRRWFCRHCECWNILDEVF